MRRSHDHVLRRLCLLIIISGSLAAAPAQYRFVGNRCEVLGEVLDRLGAKASLDDQGARQAVLARCPIIPEDQFLSVGFTDEELSRWGRPENRASAPYSFFAKLDQAQTLWRSYYASVVAGQSLSLVVSTSQVPPGTTGSAYSVTLAAAGGAGGYSWSITTGSAPPGLSLAAGGLLGGTPTTAGVYRFTVRVVDSASASASRAFDLVVSEPAPPPPSSVNFVDEEVPVGAVDGVNTVFTLGRAPSPVGSLILTRNGLVQKRGADFTISGSTVTFVSAATPQTGDLLLAWYRY